jgi:transcriptional regulator with XRE-family HTH domain
MNMIAEIDLQRAPNPVDLHVGARIRMRRKTLGISQERLAEALGLTFQQVQKYERGANRVSASKLYDIARTLRAPVAFFFEGLGDPTATGDGAQSHPEANGVVRDLVMSPEGLELAALFPKIRRRPQRRAVLELVKALAGESAEA